MTEQDGLLHIEGAVTLDALFERRREPEGAEYAPGAGQSRGGRVCRVGNRERIERSGYRVIQIEIGVVATESQHELRDRRGSSKAPKVLAQGGPSANHVEPIERVELSTRL